jgi:hypothetical protein
MADPDDLARRIAHHLPRDPPVSESVAQRLAAARELAVQRNIKRRQKRTIRIVVLSVGAVMLAALVVREVLQITAP